MKRIQSMHAATAGRRQDNGAPEPGQTAARSAAGRFRGMPVRVHTGLAATPGITVISVVGAVNDADPAAGCASCHHRTVFDNCADPVAAGLSRTFSLIGHPQQGRGCSAYAPVNEQGGVAYWRVRLLDRIEDLAVCPPEPIESIRRRFPDAVRIEPIAYADAWPVAMPAR